MDGPLPSAGMPSALGPFLVASVLGQGGSGVVYAAKLGPSAYAPAEAISGRARMVAEDTFALKVLRNDLALSDRERRRFLEEAERMRRVSHPGIVGVLDAGLLPDGRPYIAMPLLCGETLAKRLARGPLTLNEGLASFEVLAGAVAALHASGLVHRDIKPENVVLDERVGPVLLDFGIARELEGAVSTTTETGRVRGTPAYMAPERFFGISASVRTDIYELAVVLYVMLVGKLPWPEGSAAAGRLHPLPPTEHGTVLPIGISTVLLRALSTRPESRPASVRLLLDALAGGRADRTLASDRRTTASIMAVADVTKRQAAEKAGIAAPNPRWRAAIRVAAAAVFLGGMGLAWRSWAPRQERTSAAASPANASEVVLVAPRARDVPREPPPFASPPGGSLPAPAMVVAIVAPRTTFSADRRAIRGTRERADEISTTPAEGAAFHDAGVAPSSRSPLQNAGLYRDRK